jgi:hypothetical protein
VRRIDLLRKITTTAGQTDMSARHHAPPQGPAETRTCLPEQKPRMAPRTSGRTVLVGRGGGGWKPKPAADATVTVLLQTRLRSSGSSLHVDSLQ